MPPPKFCNIAIIATFEEHRVSLLNATSGRRASLLLCYDLPIKSALRLNDSGKEVKRLIGL